MSFFQVGAVLFALFMMYVIRVHAQRSRLAKWETSGWYSLWFIFAVIAIFPHWLQGISDTFYFDRVFDLLVVGAFMVLSLLVVITYFRFREIQLMLEKLVTSQAQFELSESLKKTALSRSRKPSTANTTSASRPRLSKPRGRQAE